MLTLNCSIACCHRLFEQQDLKKDSQEQMPAGTPLKTDIFLHSSDEQDVIDG